MRRTLLSDAGGRARLTAGHFCREDRAHAAPNAPTNVYMIDTICTHGHDLGSCAGRPRGRTRGVSRRREPRLKDGRPETPLGGTRRVASRAGAVGDGAAGTVGARAADGPVAAMARSLFLRPATHGPPPHPPLRARARGRCARSHDRDSRAPWITASTGSRYHRDRSASLPAGPCGGADRPHACPTRWERGVA